MKNLSGFESFSYLLFPVNQFHPDAVFPVQMLGCMLGRIDRTVLAARTSETNLEMSKPSFQTAENKTLKLTNVVSRRIQPEEFNNMQIVLTQMHNFIKSNGAQPLGPLVQCIKLPAGPNPQPEVYMMQQATQLIPRMEAGYSMDAVLRVRNCLYAHYVGPMSQSGLASQKLNIMAFEHELELTGTVYTIFVNQDDDEGVVDTFMETK